MSWNLLIHNEGEPLGEITEVARKFGEAFHGLEWESPTEAALPVDGGFRLELTADGGMVQDIYTHGGFNHIRQFAALCKREGWHMADAQEGVDVDLNDPEKWYDEHSG
jgi:hypothetical protein